MKYSAGCLFAVFVFFPSAHADGAKAFEIPRSRIVTLQDSSTQRNYELHIKLPLNYTDENKYPVVYMTDSMYTFQVVSGATRFPMNFNRMENLMLVGVSWQAGHRADLSRQRDYTPTKDSTGYFKDPTGEAAAHLSFIRDDVISYIEKNYSVDPADRAYIGNSFGGLFGAYVLLVRPDTFRHYILGSPSFWYDDEVIFDIESRYAEENDDLAANVFISVGARETPLHAGENAPDMVGLSETFYSRLKKRSYGGLKIKLVVIDEANHSTAFPTTAIQGLWWLFNRYGTGAAQ